jgi:hypothetical protein
MSFDQEKLPDIRQPKVERYKDKGGEITDELYHSSLMDLTEDEQGETNKKERIKDTKIDKKTNKKLETININYGS